ncbi:MAG: extracellular solute-binding protein, partial [Clostridia bacterium]|nr:extracellular solute-binding protein [Clostridia bacterium]
HNWGDRSNYLSLIRSSVMAGDSAWDLLFGLGYFLPGFTGEGLLSDMSELPYIDIDKKWWNRNFMETSSVDGKYYSVTGDAALSLLKSMHCIFVNLDLYEKLGVKGNLYELVESGNWTLDKTAEICANLYADLNGNTEIDKDDQLGLLIYAGNQTTGFLESCGVDIISREGKEFTFAFGNEHNANVIERLCRFLHESDGIIYLSSLEDGKNEEIVLKSPFRNGNVLMTGGWLSHADSYRDLNFRYGVIPYPKFDENQQEYHTTAQTTYTVFSIPADAKNPDRSAAVLEAMASESYRSVTPAYFETALKVKYASDDDTVKMFDLIRDHISFDFGYIYTLSMNGISDKFKSAINSNKPEWASNVAGFEATATAALDTLLTAIRSAE